MELRHLRYVVALAEELHFGRAAARLGISQPPLSQQLAALEAELGVRLFDRSRREVRLTTAGALFVEEARTTLLAAERARAVALQAERGELGELRMGLFASAPLSRGIAGAIGEFRTAYPGARLVLTEAPSQQQIQRITQGELDVGFLRSPGQPLLPAGLDAIEVVREPLCAVIPAGHVLARRAGPLAITALAGEPLPGRLLVQQVREAPSVPQRQLRSATSSGEKESSIPRPLRQMRSTSQSSRAEVNYLNGGLKPSSTSASI